jgi:hypothetical protein
MKYRIENDKIINEEGEVAVAISPEYGAGWASWGDVSPFDAEFNSLILEDKIEEAKSLAVERGIYSGGLNGIQIKWIPKNVEFVIEEYDGAESIKIIKVIETYKA